RCGWISRRRWPRWAASAPKRPKCRVCVPEINMSQVATSNASALSASRWAVWIGRALSGLVILFLVMDDGMKIAALSVVTASAVMIGWTGDAGFWRAMGLLLLAITALYAWPRTAVLGAILLTGYLG